MQFILMAWMQINADKQVVKCIPHIPAPDKNRQTS